MGGLGVGRNSPKLFWINPGLGLPRSASIADTRCRFRALERVCQLHPRPRQCASPRPPFAGSGCRESHSRSGWRFLLNICLKGSGGMGRNRQLLLHLSHKPISLSSAKVGFIGRAGARTAHHFNGFWRAAEKVRFALRRVNPHHACWRDGCASPPMCGVHRSPPASSRSTERSISPRKAGRP
jgi:hypothetical protein